MLPDGTEPELPHGTEPELPHGTEPELPHGTEPEPENLSESVIGSASGGEDDCLLDAPPESSMQFTPSARAIVDLFESSSGGEGRSTISMNGSMELFSSPAQSLSISPTCTPRSSTPNVRPTVPYSPSQSLTETRKARKKERETKRVLRDEEKKSRRAREENIGKAGESTGKSSRNRGEATSERIEEAKKVNDSWESICYQEYW